jgi:hypothetical protein
MSYIGVRLEKVAGSGRRGSKVEDSDSEELDDSNGGIFDVVKPSALKNREVEGDWVQPILASA